MKGQKGFVVASAAFTQVRLPRLAGWWRQLRRWQQLARERRQLAMIGEAGLKDLGLSRATALHESERPFWDDPLKKREVK